MVMLRIFVLLQVLIFIPSICLAKVSATVDRNIIEEGETLQLVIQADDGEPNVDVLKKDFEILSTSQSSKVSIINGSVNSVKEFIVSLLPKRIGTIIIPPLRAGNEASAPIRIQVKKPSFAKAGQGSDIFLEAKVDLPIVYVQSQILYSVRLYRAVEIREGSLTEPNLPDAVVERLGEDVTFQTRRNGRLYQVTERRFAIFPQKSGTFTIDPTVFQGQVLDNRNNSRRSNDPFDRFFQNQRTKRVRIKSDAIELTVNPQPADAEGNAWLPAKRLILLESWSPEPPVFKVGEPVTRTLRIEATGLTAAQLPELTLFPANGVKQYTDQPVTETVLKNGMLVGIREEKFAIVPTQSGKLILPELRFFWWDTELDQQQLITIAPKIIDVEAGEVTSSSNDEQKVVKEEQDLTVESPVVSKEVIKTVVEAGNWPIIAVSAIVLWLITAIGWLLSWLKNRRKSISNADISEVSNNSQSINSAIKALKQACNNDDPAAAKQALVTWAQAVWPDVASPSLSFLTTKLQDSTLNQELRELNQVLYASGAVNWNGKHFWDIVNPRLKSPRSSDNNKVKSLPELYPQHG